MQMCRFLVFLCVWLLPFSGRAELNIDSLTEAFFDFKPNQKKYVYGYDLFFLNVYSKPQVAKKIALELKRTGEAVDRVAIISQHYNMLGIYYDVTSKRDSALWAYRMGLKGVKPIDSLKKLTAGIYNNIGLIHAAREKMDSALFYYKEALSHAENDDLSFRGNISHNIGLVLEKQKQYKEAGAYLLRALRIAQKRKDNGFVGSIYHALADHHSHLKGHDSAWYYNAMAIRYLKKANDQFRLAMALHNRATYFERLAGQDSVNTDSILFYMRQSLHYKLKIKDMHRVASSAQKMAETFAKRNEVDSAWKYIKMARTHLDTTNLKRYGAYMLFLGRVQWAAGEQQSAYWTTRRAIELYDSAVTSNFREEVATIQEALNVKAKEMEIESLASQKKLSEEKSRSQGYLILGLATMVVLILLLVSIWRYRTRMKHQSAITQRELQLQEEANQLILEAQEEERHRIARDLHDGIGQQLMAIRIEWFNFLKKQELEEESSELQESFSQLADDIRSLSHQMMPKALQHLGLVAAVEDLVQGVKERMGMEIEFDCFNLKDAYEAQVELTLYRILQEALSNIVKHSKAHAVSIQLYEKSNAVILMIEDDGKGIENLGDKGAGLYNMETRVKLLNGVLNIESEAGMGTIIFVKIPL